MIVAHCFWSVVVAWLGRGLRSFAVAPHGGGGLAARVMGPWISGRGFESHRGGWRCDRTRQEGTRPGSGPPAELFSSARGPNKDPRGQFILGVCGAVL